jgi:DNA mismatch repair protein MutL
MGAACHALLLCASVPRIHLLDATLANQIAAGEVIERPAAVVKELVENALDAGAKRIEVELHDGGRRLIRVRDDGSGMGREDAALSVQRHATSKLRSKDDLFAIASYGFRGEALPSMAAVSRFTMVTSEPAALRGTRIEVEGSASPVISDAGAPAGTMVEVRDLFWNVPARRKFLKKAHAEQAQCIDAVLRLALPRPDVTFAVREGDRTLTQLQAGADVLPARAEEALGREVRGRLVPFSGESRSLRAHGLLVSPAVEYGSARNVWLFVNGRAIRDRSLTHAVLRAYGELMPHGRYPGALVFLEVPPAGLDVNVHPAKAEVRFADPRAAWDAIYTGLTQVLARGDWLPQRTGTAAVDPARIYTLGDSSQRVADAVERYGSRMPTTWWMPPAQAPIPGPQPEDGAQPDLVPRPAWFRGLRYLGQLHRTYLVCEGPEGLVLIDQHAAHERINYQRLRGKAGSGGKQPLLVPQIVQLPPAAAARISEAADMLASIGVELDSFGGTTAAVKALPAPLARLDERELGALLTDLAEELAGHGRGDSLDRLRDALLARAACHGSVRAHDALTPPEAQALLDALDETDYGARCAHGRPVVAEWDQGEIERRFGRDYASHSHAPPPEAL